MHLDTLDRRILNALDRNARLSLSELSRFVRQGRDRVSYRVERLIGEGIIEGFRAAVNSYSLGCAIYKSYLKLGGKRATVDRFLALLAAHPRVFWIAEGSGKWDLFFSVVAHSPYEFHCLHDRILSKFSSLVIEFDVFTLVNIWMCPRDYFADGHSKPYLLGGSPASLHLDILEYQILQLLSVDARMPITEIAERCNTTQTIVRTRIARFERERIIAGYRLDINLERLGITFFKVQIFLRDYRTKLGDQFRNYCLQHPRIVSFIEQVGACKLEIEIEAEGHGQFNTILDEVRERFAGIFRNCEVTSIRSEQFRWLPLDAPA